MEITRVADAALLDRWHEAHAASQAHDYVALPADPVSEFLPILDGKPRAGEIQHLYVATVDEQPVGTVRLSLPTLDNLNVASVFLDVRPDCRRRGHGRPLRDFAIAECRRLGRTRVFFQVAQREGAVTDKLLREVSARPVLEDVRRYVDLLAHPVITPSPVADGYELVQWIDRAPEDVVDGLAYLVGRMVTDSPMGEMDYEQEKWDAQRYRDSEATSIERGRTRISTLARHTASGQVAGLTEIAFNRELPEVAYQWETIVDPEHRGHRLGLALKTANHAFVMGVAPSVRWINTWNAASNTFMIAVNEQLGFQVAESWWEWQLDLAG